MLKMKKINLFCILFVILLLTGCAVPQELIVEREKKENWKGKVEFAPEYDRGKGPAFILYGKYPTPLIYNKYIPIEDGKTYTYKVSLRTLNEKLPASGYVGFYFYDENKRSIILRNVFTLDNSDSEVVSARKGDKFFIIKKMENHKKFKRFVVAFNTEKDFSDIPNFDISPSCQKLVDTGDGNLRVELRSPLKKDYAPGTATRFHSPYGVPMYYLASGWMPAGEGIEHIRVFKGVSDVPTRDFKVAGIPELKFWKGTKYARPFVWFGNYNRKPEKDARLLVDGMSLTVSE